MELGRTLTFGALIVASISYSYQPNGTDKANKLLFYISLLSPVFVRHLYAIFKKSFSLTPLDGRNYR